MPKRKRTYSNEPVAPVAPPLRRVDDEYIAASAVCNYMINDPLLDYFDIVKKSGHRSSISHIMKTYAETTEFDFFDYVRRLGVQFEEFVVGNLNNLWTVVHIDAGSTDEAVRRTNEAMQNGAEIIAQGCVRDTGSHTYGKPDLLIRDDIMREIYISMGYYAVFCRQNDMAIASGADADASASSGTGPPHYSIVDIKFANCSAGKNGTLLGKAEYKGQLCIYSDALPSADLYIWGRNGIFPVAIDQAIRDKCAAAVAWQRDLRREFRAWNALVPHRYELLPNMCNQKTAGYNGVKGYLAGVLKEMTVVNGIDFAMRQRLYAASGTSSFLRQPVYTFRAEIRNDAKFKMVSNILRINRDRPMYPVSIPSRAAMRELPRIERSYFIDVETILNFNTGRFVVNDTLGADSGTNIVYMIGITTPPTTVASSPSGMVQPKVALGPSGSPPGIGMVQPSDIDEDPQKVGYRVHVMDELTDEDERRMLVEWLNSLDIRRRLVHWTAAEPRFLCAALEKHGLADEWLRRLRWFDLHEWFVKHGIVIHGAYNYKLKDIARAFYTHGLINTCWNDEVKGGLDSMMMALKFYESRETADGPLINKVIDYNYVDCQVMYEMVKYLYEL